MGIKTVINYAGARKNEYFKAYIPKFLVEKYRLESGDFLDWDMGVVDGEMVIIVRPFKKVKVAGSE